jgi:hypothetical protein
MDLFYRLLRAGARIRYEPDLMVYHARTNRAGRISRRSPYGYGMGACCILWLRQKDSQALRVLAHWFLLRFHRLWEGIRTRDRMLVYEELLVIAGTVRGFIAGRRLSMINGTSNSNNIRYA